MRKKKILIISFSELSKDPRVFRQISTLYCCFDLSAVGFGENFNELVRFYKTSSDVCANKIKSAILLLFRVYDKYYWSINYVNQALNFEYEDSFDIIIANDILALPLAFKIADGKSKIIFDAHEYAPREFEDLWRWRLLFQGFNYAYCKKFLPLVDGMMTVCQGIADEYERNFGVKSVVVTNAPAYRDLSPSLTRHDIIRMIHHGGAMSSRHLEDMIEMMDFLDERFSLDFMLVPTDKKYLNQLKLKASKNLRIRFVEPVAMQDIPEFCNKYDIGVFLLRPVNFNYMCALPNKLFEFIQSRLAVAIGPSPEMVRIVTQYDCGIVAESFAPKELANKLNALTCDQIQYFKGRSHLAAKELCAEKNAETIFTLVDGV